MIKIKNILFILVVVLLLSSCATVKRCQEKFPAKTVRDTINTTQIVYHDTVITIQLPGDTVLTTMKIKLPCPEKVPVALRPISTDTVVARTNLAEAKSWLMGTKIKLQLIQFDTTITRKLDSAKMEVNRLQKITEQQKTYVPVVKKKSFKHGFIVGAISMIVFLILLKVVIKNL